MSCISKNTVETKIEFKNEKTKKGKFNISLPKDSSNKIPDHHLALIYPIGLCDVCDQDIFRAINNSNKKEFINQAVVYIPFENYRDFILHNQDYNLNFKNIIPYKVGSDLNIDFSRATFAVIKNGLFEIIFEPTKPIDTNTFNEFIYESEKLLKSN